MQKKKRPKRNFTRKYGFKNSGSCSGRGLWRTTDNKKAEVKVKRIRKPRFSKRYIAYIESDEWYALRHKILERDKYTCQKCGSKTKTLHIHHLTYENLCHEKLSDLITLCKSCHKETHNVAKL